MTNIVCALVSLSLSALYQPAPAPEVQWNQGAPLPCLEVVPSNTIEWPTLSGPNDPVEYRRIVVAELDGDHAPEGIALEDGQAVAFWTIAVHDAPEEITFPTKDAPVAVADLAVLPGEGPEGRDALLMTDWRGLYRVKWDESFLDPVILATGSWIDAKPILTVDLDRDGDHDVMGLAADKRTIVALRNDGGGAFAPLLPIVETFDVREIAAVDWDHDGPRERVALTTRGILVHFASGELIATVGHLSATGCVTRLESPDLPGGEALAWTRGTTSGVSQLVLLGHQLVDGPWNLEFDVCGSPTQVHPTAVVAGDYDENGSQELVLVHAGQAAIVLANQGSPPHFVPGNGLAYDVIPLSEFPQAPASVGIPAFAQVDEEVPEELCPLDLVFPVSTTAEVQVFLNPSYERAIGGSTYTSSDIAHPQSEFGYLLPPQDSGELRFAYHVPVRYQDYAYLDMILWEEPGGSSTVSTDGVAYRRHALAPNPNNQLVAAPYQWIHVDHAFPLTDGQLCWPPEQPCYYTQYRFVKIGASGEVMSPIFTGGFSLDGCSTGQTNQRQYLIQLGIPGSSFDLFEDNDLPEAMPRHMVGIYVPMSSQPPFPDNSHPDPGERSPGAAAEAFTPNE